MLGLRLPAQLEKEFADYCKRHEVLKNRSHCHRVEKASQVRKNAFADP